MPSDQASRYINKLRQELQYRETPGAQIIDVVRQVESHLADTGEDPHDAFGDPETCAKQFTPPGPLPKIWPLTSASAVLTIVGGWLLASGITGLVGGRRILWGVEPMVGIVVGGLLIAAWIVLLTTAVQLWRARRHSNA